MIFTKRRLFIFFFVWLFFGLPFFFITLSKQENKGIIVLWHIFIVVIYAWKVWRRRDIGKLRKIVTGYLMGFPATIAGLLTDAVFGNELIGVTLFAFVFLTTPTFEIPEPTLEEIKRRGKLTLFIHRYFGIHINQPSFSSQTTSSKPVAF